MKLFKKTKEAEKLTNWVSEPTWKDLDKDYSQAYDVHEEFKAALAEYRETMNGGPDIKVKRGKSKVKSYLVRKTAEWKYSQLEEPFLSTPDLVKLSPRSSEDAPNAKQCQVLANYYMNVRINKIMLISDIARSLVNDGTVVVKNGWYTEKKYTLEKEVQPIYATDEEKIALVQKMLETEKIGSEEARVLLESDQPMMIGEEVVEVKKEKIVKNHPTHEVCELENIIIDPTCRGMLSEANFVIHEYDTDYSTLLKDKYNPETGTGYYKNLDAIDFEQDWEETDETKNRHRSDVFTFSDKARKKVRIKEYWGYWDIAGSGIKEPIVASWIGETIVRLEKNPFPHGKLPFSATTYMPVMGEFYGEPDAKLLRDNQAAIGRMKRAIADITTTKAIGQRLVMEDTFTSQSDWDAFEMGNDARYRAGVDINRAIHEMHVNPVDQATFQVIQMEQQEAESLSGTSVYNRGLAGANAEVSATGIKNATDSASRRELSILRRMSSQLFEDMIRQDIENMQMFARPEEVVRITNEEFRAIKREDIQGEFDVIVDVSTPAKDAETAETLSFILQAAGNGIDPKIKNYVLADILRLKKRPDLAKVIETYEPQPSEAELQMQQIQMENAQLENELLKAQLNKLSKELADIDSKIEERDRLAMTKEVKAKSDSMLAEAKSKEHLERADYYKESADELSRKFVARDSGEERRQEVNDLVFRENMKLQIAELKQKVKDKNNG